MIQKYKIQKCIYILKIMIKKIHKESTEKKLQGLL